MPQIPAIRNTTLANLMLTSLCLEVVPPAPWLRRPVGFPAPEEMQCQAEPKRTEDPPDEVWRAPEDRADTDRDRPLQNAEPDRLRAARSRYPDFPLECFQCRHVFSLDKDVMRSCGATGVRSSARAILNQRIVSARAQRIPRPWSA